MKKLMILATLALLAAPVASTSGTMVFAEDNTATSSSSEDTTDWVAELKNSETKAQLYYKYTVETSGGITNYTIDYISLRFGALIPNEMFFYTYESFNTYGIAWSTVSPKDKDCDNFVDAVSKYSSDELKYEERSIKNGQQMGYYYDSDENLYYSFNVFIEVNKDSIDSLAKTVYAAAKMTLNNGDEFYFKETAYSVESIAKAYIADTKTFASYSADVQNTLTMLSQGFISGKSTDSVK